MEPSSVAWVGGVDIRGSLKSVYQRVPQKVLFKYFTTQFSVNNKRIKIINIIRLKRGVLSTVQEHWWLKCICDSELLKMSSVQVRV